MQITFVSNYINHHQIPFCNAMCIETEGNFTFIQTEPMEEERVRMGWGEEEPTYAKYIYKEPEVCENLILNSDIVIYGGAEEECYIVPRLKAGKPIFRYSERIYKTGQWKAVSPRGLHKKYIDHTKYRNKNVFLLCAGGYVPSDFHIIRAYPQKMYRWGYFPETKHYNEFNSLMDQKGYVEGNEKKTYILWAARFIDWKYPEHVIELARKLKENGYFFQLDMIGGGPLEDKIKAMISQYQLEDMVHLKGFMEPSKVRSYMERADIYLATSNREEGWGAVINEAMNSGCAVVANHEMGASPYLIRHGKNGFLYENGKEQQLYTYVVQLIQDSNLRKTIGAEAYKTITQVWNAENAAACLMQLIKSLNVVKKEKYPPVGQIPNLTEDGPCSKAPIISERKMYGYLTNRN